MAPPTTSSSPSASAPWDLIVDADKAGWGLRLKELWRYRDLLYLLARRDVITMYKQTILGPIWFVLQPLLTSLLFVVVFSRIAGLSTDGVPPLLFYLSGQVMWGFFADSLKTTSDSFVLNAELFQKVYFPRATVPAASVLAGSIRFVIQLGLLAAFFVYYVLIGEMADLPGFGLLAIIPIALGVATLGLGFGLLLSSLTYKYRDLQLFVQFGVQLAMYATPVIYPLSIAPEQIKPVFALNPMSGYMEAFRFVTVGSGTVEPWMLMYSAAASVIVLFLGMLAFNRAERTFADTV